MYTRGYLLADLQREAKMYFVLIAMAITLIVIGFLVVRLVPNSVVKVIIALLFLKFVPELVANSPHIAAVLFGVAGPVLFVIVIVVFVIGSAIIYLGRLAWRFKIASIVLVIAVIFLIPTSIYGEAWQRLASLRFDEGFVTNVKASGGKFIDLWESQINDFTIRVQVNQNQLGE